MRIYTIETFRKFEEAIRANKPVLILDVEFAVTELNWDYPSGQMTANLQELVLNDFRT